MKYIVIETKISEFGWNVWLDTTEEGLMKWKTKQRWIEGKYTKESLRNIKMRKTGIPEENYIEAIFKVIIYER